MISLQSQTCLESNSGNRSHIFSGIVVVLVLIVICYFKVLGTPFSLIDDVAVIQNNPRYLNPSFNNFVLHFTQPEWDIFAPLTFGIWHVISMFSGNSESGTRIDPLLFKCVSLLVHCASSIALGHLLFALRLRTASVLMGVLIFALHPMQVESVAWTTGLKDELCGLFSFMAIGGHLTYLNTFKTKHKNWSLIFVIAAVMSKPTAVILPVMLLVIDYYWTKRGLGKILADTGYYFIPAAISLLIMMNIQHPVNIHSPLWCRPLVMLDSLAFYLYKILLPLNLVSDYGRSPVYVIRHGFIYWTPLIPIIFAVLLIKLSNRYLLIASILFMLPILTVSGIVTFDMQRFSTVTDHYLYQSMAGVALLAAYVVERWKVALYPVGIGIVVIAGLTYQQTSNWRDQRLPLVRNVELYPQSIMPRAILASDYYARQQFDVAERYARDVIAIDGKGNDLGMLSLILYSQRKIDEANQLANRALDQGWNNSIVLYLAASEAKNTGQLDVALRIIRRNIELDPGFQQAIRLRDEISTLINRNNSGSPATNRSDKFR